MSAKDTTTTYGLEEVQKHTSSESLWIVIERCVYDVTPYLSRHPGGEKALLRNGGKDATTAFNLIHGADARSKLSEFKIGVLEQTKGAAAAAVVSPPSPVASNTFVAASIVNIIKETSAQNATIILKNPNPSVYNSATFPLFGHVQVEVTSPITGTGIRSYSPISITDSEIRILVKSCGEVSGYLCGRSVGDSIRISEPHPPMCALNGTLRLRSAHVGFIAAGSGITPFLSVVREISTSNKYNVKKLTVINCHKNKQNMVGTSLLQQSSTPSIKQYNHFSYPVPNQPSRVSKDDLIRYGAASMSQVIICGPVSFNSYIKNMFLELGLLETSIWCLQ